LPASALVVTDASQPRPALVRSNAPSPPRVLFLLDTSSSLPPEFLGAQAAGVVHDMGAGVAAIDPASQFAVASVYEGLSGLSNWMSDLDILRTTAASALGYQSALWFSLAEAALTDASVIVFITDGVAEEPPTDLDLQRVSNGPPVVMLGVGDVDQPTLRRMAELSGGTSGAVTQSAEAVTSVASFLRARRSAPLDIQYTASKDGPSSRPVTLQVGKAPVSAPVSYDVPVAGQRSVPDGVAGVYLTLTYDNQSVTRTLAGGTFAANDVVPQATLDEVRLALLGEYAVSFEGGAPTTAQWFDDMAAAKLALEPLWTAAHQHVNGTKLAEALATLQPTIQRTLPVLHTALPAASNSLVFETGLRAVLLASYPVPGKGLRTRADILPFTRFATAVDDDSAFSKTLEASLLLALAEKSVYTTSTVALLEGKSLLGLRDYPDLEEAMPTVAPERRAALKRALEPYENNINVVAQDASVLAFFTIDRRTGSALAIMPDGSGGGLSGDDKRSYDSAMSLANWLSVVGEFGGLGFAFGGVVALSKAILRVITAEALMVAAIGTDEDPGNPFADGGCNLACDLAKSTVSEVFGLGALSKADALADALGPGGYSCGCGSGP
jgi:hypothetical protein